MADTDIADFKVDVMMFTDGTESLASFDGTIDPASLHNTFGFNGTSIMNCFDFESAAGSTGTFDVGPLDMVYPEMLAIKYEAQPKSPTEPKTKLKSHSKTNSQHSITQSMRVLTTNGSREASPASAIVVNQDSSSPALFPSSSPPSMGFDFMNEQILSQDSQDHVWSSDLSYGTLAAPIKSVLTPPPLANNTSSPLSSCHSTLMHTLTIHPTPLKSRVETQIPIKMTLFPMPPGVTKLHLPTYTVSKPKLLAKPPPDKSPDTLELYTMLVCTSAMQNPEFRSRAFARAASIFRSQNGQPSDSTDSKDRTFDDDEESKPLNGGEVKICPGCIVRERKRAARKKVKKVEEEESWHRDEKKRVIVFNTHEIKEWQLPSSQVLSENVGERLEPLVPEGAMQIDAPMRIACYCRHQNEKLGFQVIFTIKDYNDNVIAQELSSSIMITDDHKTHSFTPLPTQVSIGSEGQIFTGPSFYSSESSFDLPMVPFRQSRSSSDLQGLQRDFPTPYLPPGGNIFRAHSSQSICAISPTINLRNLPRQASPSSAIGPNAKKRKGSGYNKIPSSLTMTRLETNQLIGPSSAGLASSGSTTATTPSLSNEWNMGTSQSPQDNLITHLPQAISSIPQQYNTGPPTPSGNEPSFLSNANRSHSMENLTTRQFYSAPASAHQSRAPSPNNGSRNNSQNYPQAQAHAIANTLYSIPLSLNSHRPPTIHKIIPSEGPISGGIEVSCLGSGFYQGLEVMFGDIKATTTTYWGETSLVCLLPPSPFAGHVSVTFKHQHQQQQAQAYPTPPSPNHQISFRYLDDRQQGISEYSALLLHGPSNPQGPPLSFA